MSEPTEPFDDVDGSVTPSETKFAAKIKTAHDTIVKYLAHKGNAS